MTTMIDGALVADQNENMSQQLRADYESL